MRDYAFAAPLYLRRQHVPPKRSYAQDGTSIDKESEETLAVKLCNQAININTIPLFCRRNEVIQTRRVLLFFIIAFTFQLNW